MNGVMMPSVSAGSSHREARVMCTPQIMVPSGAALTGLTAPSVSAMTSAGRKGRQHGTVMTSPLMNSGRTLPEGHLIAANLAPATARQSRHPPPRDQHEGDHDGDRTEAATS